MKLLRVLRLLRLLRLLCLLPLAVSAGEERSFTFAVVPQFTAAEIHRDWQPLLDRLREMTGIDFRLRHSRSIPEFEQDFLTGILVVRSDDPLKSVRQLDGREIAFPAPNAFGASLYLRALLAEEFHIRVTPRYVKTHSNVYRHVIMGEVAAGGGVNNTLAHESAAVHRALSDAMLRLAADPANAPLLAAVQLPKPVAADYARDYSGLEKLNLDRYVVSGEAQP